MDEIDPFDFEVEKIIDHKEENNSQKYLVRWKEYSPDGTEDKWEQESQLGGARISLKAYISKHNHIPKSKTVSADLHKYSKNKKLFRRKPI